MICVRPDIIRRIGYLGYDLYVTVEQLDQYVDNQIAKHLALIEEWPEARLHIIYQFEDARQQALLCKYCLTVQPLS